MALNGALSALYSFFVTKLPYITIAVFLLGVAYRLQRWLSAPKGPKGRLKNRSATRRNFLPLR